MNSGLTPKTIKLHRLVTPKSFGCSDEVFEAHVKGRELVVTKKYQHFYVVDVNSDLHVVHESELERLNKAHGNSKV